MSIEFATQEGNVKLHETALQQMPCIKALPDELSCSRTAVAHMPTDKRILAAVMVGLLAPGTMHTAEAPPVIASMPCCAATWGLSSAVE